MDWWKVKLMKIAAQHLVLYSIVIAFIWDGYGNEEWFSNFLWEFFSVTSELFCKFCSCSYSKECKISEMILFLFVHYSWMLMYGDLPYWDNEVYCWLYIIFVEYFESESENSGEEASRHGNGSQSATFSLLCHSQFANIMW